MSAPWLPVARPRLPPVAAIAPYLAEIEASGHYSNFGPLNARLEARLAAHFGVAAERVVTVANGTLGLAAALMAAGAAPGSLCLMPAWTFAATAHAARVAGLMPCFADVDADIQALTPALAAAALAVLPGPVGAVMPVLPFGQPVDLAAWDAFAEAHRVPVVIDAAAGFDGVRPQRAPVVVSLHATKVCGIGEGGVVIGPDIAFARALRRCINFGFFMMRTAQVPALNAKLSEYSAAVGLAALDRWPEERAAFLTVAGGYRRLVGDLPDVELAPGYGESWLSATAVIRLARPEARPLAQALAGRGIDSRAWWGEGVHRQPAFLDCPRTPVPATAWLAQRTLGLPCFPALTAAGLDRIGAALAGLTVRDTARDAVRDALTGPALVE